jgi:hypothetical protein
MTISNDQTRRIIAGCLVVLMSVPWAQGNAQPPQQEPAQAIAKSSPPIQSTSTSANNQVHPQSAAAVQSENAATSLPDAPSPQSSSPSGQQPDQSHTGTQQQDDGAKPVGTAAAPYEKITGVAASRPAGAAIAPAKQRRVRTILISLGVVAGAAIAIGTVAALSHGSPSHPN